MALFFSGTVSKTPRNPLLYLGFVAEGAESIPKTGLSSTIDLNQVPPHPFYKEPVFISLDVEGSYSYTMSIEWGVSMLDTRDLGPRQKPQPSSAAPPGDRGQNWFKFIKTRHFIVIDNLEFDQQHARYLGKGNAGAFAFSKSKEIKSTEVQRTLTDYFKNAKKRNLNPGEQERYVILLTWDSHFEERQTHREGIPWFNDADECWDIQKMKFARVIAQIGAGKQGPWPKAKIEELNEWLGLGVPAKLLHNGGNDAAFELEGMLAGALLTEEQFSNLGLEALASLPRNWQEQTLDGNKRK